MTEFRDILQAKYNGNKTLLSELSLSRAYKHFTDAESKSFAVFTAFRSAQALNVPPLAADSTANQQKAWKEQVLALNRKRNVKLKNDIKSLGLGYSKLLGHWRECPDATITYKDCPEDQLVDVVEESLFVNGISLDDLVRLLHKYDQDMGVFMGPETGGNVWIVTKTGSHDSVGTKFSPNTVAQAFSKLKGGRTFVFEYVAQSYQETLIETAFQRTLDMTTSQGREAQMRELHALLKL